MIYKEPAGPAWEAVLPESPTQQERPSGQLQDDPANLSFKALKLQSCRERIFVDNGQGCSKRDRQEPSHSHMRT